jgi:hypothetical protein
MHGTAMKFYTPEKSLLIDVRAIKEHPEGIVIEGKIMGTMPMKAVLHPKEMRSAIKLITWRVARRAIGMLIRGGKPCPTPKTPTGR